MASGKAGAVQILPVDAACREVLAVVSDDPEKRVIGLENPTVEVPDERRR